MTVQDSREIATHLASDEFRSLPALTRIEIRDRLGREIMTMAELREAIEEAKDKAK